MLLLNCMINQKTAEKTLQFGVNKCKLMYISKNNPNLFQSQLFVDKWKVSYRENPKNNHSVELMETFHGLSEIEEVKSQTYLGFVISSTSDNMAHIKFVKQKAIGVVRKIFECDSQTEYFIRL